MNSTTRKILSSVPPRFASVLDGASYLINNSPVGMDSNGSEMITDTDDRTFETTKGNWADNGNHSAVRDTTYKQTGTASLKITATGAGDAAMNYESLAADKFTTIVSGNNFTKELRAYGDTNNVTLAMKIGNKVVTGKVVYNAVAGTFTTLVFNFLATVSTVNQPIQLYLSGAGNVWVDDLSLTPVYDTMMGVFCKLRSASGGTFLYTYGANGGINITNLNDGTTAFQMRYNGSTSIAISYVGIPNLLLNKECFLAITNNRVTNEANFYLNGVLISTASFSAVVGKMLNTQPMILGYDAWNSFTHLNGLYSEFQYIKFPSLPSNIELIMAAIWARKKQFSSYARGTIAAWYDFKNGSRRDKSGNGNHLSMGGGFVPIVRI